MKTFEIEIQEILSRIVEIDARSEDEALQKVKEMYQKEEIVLDSSDYLDTEIKELDNE
ncbi:MAG TPA: protein dpnD [Ignavibacteria bacterium]|nr:protein dpnD [Ignavibacteria bacterium]